MANPVQQLDDQIAKVDFAVIVFYRGSWCPFCIAYLKDLQSLVGSINAANGTTIAVTAETEIKLPTTEASTGYRGTTIVDTQNLLATELRRRGVVDVAITKKSGYPNGMAQPAVVVMKRDGTVMYSWAIVPSIMNIGGAKDRPMLKEVWENISADLRGQSPVHKDYSKTTLFGVLGKKIFG